MDFKTDEIISTLKEQLQSHNANIDVSGKNRIGIQIFNNTANAGTYKVWGNLVSASTEDLTSSTYTQIGDDIAVAGNTNAYRAISTTPIYNLGVTGVATGSYTTTNVYIMADWGSCEFCYRQLSHSPHS